MKEYPDPQEIYDQHIEDATQKYIDGSKKARLNPSKKLARAIIERAVSTATDECIDQIEQTYAHNVSILHQELKRSHQKLKIVRRALMLSNIRHWFFICSPIALTILGIIVYCFADNLAISIPCLGVAILVIIAFFFLVYLDLWRKMHK